MKTPLIVGAFCAIFTMILGGIVSSCNPPREREVKEKTYADPYLSAKQKLERGEELNDVEKKRIYDIINYK